MHSAYPSHTYVWTGTVWVPMLAAAGGAITVAGANTPADNFVTPTNAVPVQTFGQLYDGATWDLWRGTSAVGAGNVAEQLAPGAEDNTNNVYATVPKPLAVSTYTASVSTNKGAANSVAIKGSAGNVFSALLFNGDTVPSFAFFCNLATAPVAGTASFLAPIVVGAGQQIVVGEDFFGQTGINFSTGIGLAYMTTMAGGTLATAANCFWTVRYA